MASIVKRATANGGARYDVRHRVRGRAVTKTFRRRQDADAYRRQVEHDELVGTPVDPRAGKATLAAYAAEWLETHPGLRPRSRETYESQWRLHVLPTLGEIPLGKITPTEVRRWHSDLAASGLGAPTVAKCYRLLRTILATAVTDDLIARNPCRIDGAGIERAAERPVATVAQVYAAADAIAPRFRAAVLVAGFLGLRLGELLGLENRHVNLLHGTMRVEQQQQSLADGSLILGPPKTAAGVRTLTLPPFLVAELEVHLATYSAPGPDGRVFTGEKGGPVRPHVLGAHWTRARAAAGLEPSFHFHDLRHTANTLTAAAGASTAELMARMGHASHQAALRYQHATRDRDAVLATALDGFVIAARDGRAMEADSAAGS